jgi:hypothetical protein
VGLDLPHSEGTALLDRLGGYLFTGLECSLPVTLLRATGTLDSLRLGAWPFVDLKILNLGGAMDMKRWPRHPKTN